jgi:hypothetical protein
MGSTIKTMMRIMTLTHTGDLRPESAICDLGATQIFGDGAEEGVRSFLDFYSKRTPKAKAPETVPAETVRKIAKGGFLGELLELAGFEYLALDIFTAPRTILFDLNAHAPGPKLLRHLDMVMNLGTTEHVFNQFRAFQTIHDLTKPGGVIYHDLPMAGYLDHAFFRYDPLFFRTVLPANNYEVLVQEISMGGMRSVAHDVQKMGYTSPTVQDMGIEVVMRRNGNDAFKVPLESSTSLGVDSAFGSVTANEYIDIPVGTVVTYGGSFELNSVPLRTLLPAVARALLKRLRP